MPNSNFWTRRLNIPQLYCKFVVAKVKVIFLRIQCFWVNEFTIFFDLLFVLFSSTSPSAVFGTRTRKCLTFTYALTDKFVWVFTIKAKIQTYLLDFFCQNTDANESIWFYFVQYSNQLCQNTNSNQFVWIFTSKQKFKLICWIFPVKNEFIWFYLSKHKIKINFLDFMSDSKLDLKKKQHEK